MTLLYLLSALTFMVGALGACAFVALAMILLDRALEWEHRRRARARAYRASLAGRASLARRGRG